MVNLLIKETNFFQLVFISVS